MYSKKLEEYKQKMTLLDLNKSKMGFLDATLDSVYLLGRLEMLEKVKKAQEKTMVNNDNINHPESTVL